MSSTTTASRDEAMIDFYDELDLDRDDSTVKLREHLEELHRGWLGRSRLSGAEGEKARRKLPLVEQAQEVFANDDARELYDLRLARNNTQPTEQPQKDWQAQAWSYYFMQDYGAAEIAARKSREASPDAPMPYVISAWVALAEGNLQETKRYANNKASTEGKLQEAKRYANEAFVLDDLKENSVDINHLRAVIFYHSGDNDRALHAINQAITDADIHLLPIFLSFRAMIHQRSTKNIEAFEDYILAISLSPENSSATIAEISSSARNIVPTLASSFGHLRQGLRDIVEATQPGSPKHIAANTLLKQLGDQEQKVKLHKELSELRQNLAQTEAEISILSRDIGTERKAQAQIGEPPLKSFPLGYFLLAGILLVVFFSNLPSPGFLAIISLIIAGIAIPLGFKSIKESDDVAEQIATIQSKQEAVSKMIHQLTQRQQEKTAERKRLKKSLESLEREISNAAKSLRYPQ